MSTPTLYERLGGYDAINAVCENLLPRLQADARLGRFRQNRGADGLRREKQLLVDFLCASAGGPLFYTGRDMATSHRGMRISAADWSSFVGHLNATLDVFKVPHRERGEVIAFVNSTKRRKGAGASDSVTLLKPGDFPKPKHRHLCSPDQQLRPLRR